MQTSTKYNYPSAPRDETIFDEKGFKDFYKALENYDSEETKAFVENQNNSFESFVKDSNVKESLQKSLKKNYDYANYDCPKLTSKGIFYVKYEPQLVLYHMETVESQPKKVLDEAEFGEGVNFTKGMLGEVILGFSPDMKYLMFNKSKAGTDWSTIHVVDLENNYKVLEDEIGGVKHPEDTWSADSKGFFYVEFPVKGVDKDKLGTSLDTKLILGNKIMYHKIGTPIEEDKVIYHNAENPSMLFMIKVSNDGKCLWINQCKAAAFRQQVIINIEDLSNLKPITLFDDFTRTCDFVYADAENLYANTSYKASKGRIVKIPIANPTSENWTDLIPEGDNIISSAHPIKGDKIAVVFTQDVHHVIRIFDIKQNKFERDVKLPGIGTVSVRSSPSFSDFFYAFGSFLTPGTIYRYSYEKDESQVFTKPVIEGFNPEDYETEQVFYESKDGTKIPMFITHKKNFVKDGSKPLYLTGYGGFGVSLMPKFDGYFVSLLKHLDCSIALANIRGGSEYGSAWHQAAVKGNRQTSFYDFQYGAEYLLNNKYTNKDKLIAYGGSHGGFLLGACYNQRPDLFGAIIIRVGVFDMLKYHRYSIGPLIVPEYGSSDTPEEYEYLKILSPLHNVKGDGRPYPAILLTTGDHDDRVPPFHSYKMIAELQHEIGQKDYQERPLMMKVYKDFGHGQQQKIEQTCQIHADQLSFVAKALKMEWKE